MGLELSDWGWLGVGPDAGEVDDGVAAGNVGLLSCWIRTAIRMPTIGMMTLVTPINTSKSLQRDANHY
jgi:hypothetical protein